MHTVSNQLKSSFKIAKTASSLLYCQANKRWEEKRLLKSIQENRTVPTVRLGLDKIKTKRYGTDRSSTYTIISRLYRIKKVPIREKTCIALRVW